MNNSTFAKSFGFRVLSLRKYRHTDNSRGVEVNYLALMERGTARIVSDKRSIELAEGDIFFIPNGCRYHSYWYGNDEIRWISISFPHFPSINDIGYPLQKIVPDAQELEDISGAIRSLAGQQPDCSAIGQLYTIMGRLMPYMETEQRSPQRSLVDTAMRCMSVAPEASIAEVAKKCSVSESGLYAAFRAEGTTPVRARQQMQIDRAVSLLSTTDLTIDAIAERTGFSSAAYFLRVLRKLTGKTTREIRRDAII